MKLKQPLTDWTPPPPSVRAAIASGDSDAIRDFFTANESIIRRFSRRIIGMVLSNLGSDYRQYTVEDVVNQIYADLQYYNLEDSLSFFIGMKRSLNRIGYGGYTAIYTSVKRFRNLDAPINAHTSKMETSQTTLAEVLCGDCDLFDVCFPPEDRKKRDYPALLQFMEQTIPDKCKLNYVFCKVFTNLEDNEIKGGEYDEFRPYV